ncbi:hypothetical protein EJ03DRAFT_323959 [Teratosphaeria nubilosa]|uniref:Uncharacterized protein n=1 Tax=Teratosphaeria nubilosa TaxID=161662 RepID=A0A6G1LKT1_9PEZI|nr:hypothetical protein EJ03DRAFT_323959 [Teratosphaeria nubilosa]
MHLARISSIALPPAVSKPSHPHCRKYCWGTWMTANAKNVPPPLKAGETLRRAYEVARNAINHIHELDLDLTTPSSPTCWQNILSKHVCQDIKLQNVLKDITVLEIMTYYGYKKTSRKLLALYDIYAETAVREFARLKKGARSVRSTSLRWNQLYLHWHGPDGHPPTIPFASLHSVYAAAIERGEIGPLCGLLWRDRHTGTRQ